MALTTIQSQMLYNNLYGDASGNIGIGTSSPASRLQITGTTSVSPVLTLNSPSGASDTKAGKISFLRNATEVGYITMDAVDANLDISSSDATYGKIKFLTGGTERMRIDSSGNLLVGTTNAQTGSVCFSFDGAVKYGLILDNTSTIGSGQFVQRFRQNGAFVGSIQTTSTATFYVTSSDYRLKENIAPMTGALAKVQALKPVTYTWKSTGEASQGFIAHELQAVVPDCVTGEKDAVDAEGNPEYQGIDTSFLVATLTAAIQELKSELDTVKTELETLKAQ